MTQSDTTRATTSQTVIRANTLTVTGSSDTFNIDAKLTVKSKAVATTDQLPTITSSTTDLTAGSSTLATGAIYLVYE